MVFSRLFTVGANGEVAPDLVNRVDAKEGGLTYELELRAGVRWHDGEAFSSEDVLFTFELLRSDAYGKKLRPWLSEIRSVEAPSPAQVTIQLKKAIPSLPYLLTKLAIFPAHLFASAKERSAEFDALPIGTGPYAYEHIAENQVRLRKHEHHYQVGRIDHIHISHYAEDHDRAAAVASGEIDLAQVKPQNLGLFIEEPSVTTYRYSTGVWRGFVFNLERPTLSDARVRRGISTLIDRQEIVDKVLLGYGRVANGPIPHSNWAYPSNLPDPVRDETSAFRLFEEAGWTRGDDGTWLDRGGDPITLRIGYLKYESFRREASKLIAKQLGESGLRVELVPVGWEEYMNIDSAGLGKSVIDCMAVGWDGLVDPYDNIADKYMSNGLYNKHQFSNPELDKCLTEAWHESDRSKAMEMYSHITELVNQDCIMPALINTDYVFAANSELEGLGGYTIDSFYEFPRFFNNLYWRETDA
jgi:peptide/nickel transport system substrate-binding protein